MAVLTDATMSCEQWAGLGHQAVDPTMGSDTGVNMADVNTALSAMASGELALLDIACAAVAGQDIATSSGVTCRNHEVGHACALRAAGTIIPGGR